MAACCRYLAQLPCSLEKVAIGELQLSLLRRLPLRGNRQILLFLARHGLSDFSVYFDLEIHRYLLLLHRLLSLRLADELAI